MWNSSSTLAQLPPLPLRGGGGGGERASPPQKNAPPLPAVLPPQTLTSGDSQVGRKFFLLGAHAALSVPGESRPSFTSAFTKISSTAGGRYYCSQQALRWGWGGWGGGGGGGWSQGLRVLLAEWSGQRGLHEEPPPPPPHPQTTTAASQCSVGGHGVCVCGLLACCVVGAERGLHEEPLPPNSQPLLQPALRWGSDKPCCMVGAERERGLHEKTPPPHPSLAALTATNAPMESHRPCSARSGQREGTSQRAPPPHPTPLPPLVAATAAPRWGSWPWTACRARTS